MSLVEETGLRAYIKELVVETLHFIVQKEFKVAMEANNFKKPIMVQDFVKDHNDLAGVSKILRDLGIPVNVLGYKYLREALLIGIEDIKVVESLTKRLYPMIAGKYNSVPTRVERAMRHAIEISWIKADKDNLRNYFNITDKMPRPSNKEYITTILDKINLGR